MTRLLKIESYIECCHYARLFGQDPDKFIPNLEDLPIAYKNFLEYYSDIPYIDHPLVVSELAVELHTSKKAANNYIGQNIEDGSNNKLLIVRDSNVLLLREFRHQYLYASAYHYWNFVSQVSKSIDLKNYQVVFIDLDAFTPASRIPIEFKESTRTPYLIPILDTRKIGTYESLNLEFNPKTVYKNICDRLAQEIINKNSSISTTAQSSISSYLQEVNFFKILQIYLAKNAQSRSINILVRHPQNNGNSYLKTELEIDLIDKIVTETINYDILQSFACKNANYKIVLVSQYNFLPNFSKTLSSFFYLPDITRTDFNQIWKQKMITNFPLFGQYLDKISFEVGNEPHSFWIDVPSQDDVNTVSFEGESKRQKFIGKYKRGNDIISTFPMKYKSVELPIKINDQPLLIKGVEQIYQITNQFFEETPQIIVTVTFSIRLGFHPILEVKDNKNRSIDSKVIDKIKYISSSKTIGFISFEEILRSRRNNSDQQKAALPNRLDLIKLEDTIRILKQCNIKEKFTARVIPTRSLDKYHNLIENLYDFFRNDCLRFVDFNSEDPYINQFLTLLYDSGLIEDFNEAFQNFAYHLSRLENLPNTDRVKSIKNIYNRLILIFGKMYGVSEYVCLNFLFEDSYLPFRLPYDADEYIKTLARVAKPSILCKKYISLFEQTSRSKNCKYFLLSSYIWGYARVLLWYLDFKDAFSWLNYKQHFISIASNLLKFNKKHNVYVQDAFISLIYLLTFRELDPEFCGLNSQEYKIALQVKDRFSNELVHSKQAGLETSLNETFAKLLEGTATVQETRKLLEID